MPNAFSWDRKLYCLNIRVYTRVHIGTYYIQQTTPLWQRQLQYFLTAAHVWRAASYSTKINKIKVLGHKLLRIYDG